jgi:hypothetical protein
VLSQDLNNHWVLWDYSSNTKILSGDQVVPPFVPPYSTSIFSWPVDMAGQIFVIGQTNGLDVRATSDGHVVFQLQSPQIDSAQGGTWWKLARDGSYVCNGSQGGLTIWSSTGQQLVTLQGDYSAANAYAAPGQVLVALGPAGQNVIQVISVPSGTSSTGPAFSGTFNSWFTDGQNFFTTTAGASDYTVNTYSSATTVLQSSVSLPTIENLTGQGNWFWTYEGFTLGYPLNIYPINSGTPSTTLNLDTNTVLVPSGNTIGVLPFGTPSASVIDLSGASPVKSDYSLPIAYEKAYAATSTSQWIIGNVHGVVLDGTSAATTPRYFGTGQVLSIAGGTNYFAIATAIGKIFYYSPSSSSTTPVGTISFSSSGLALSSDGTVLGAMANASDSQYETDRTLNVYSLPSGNLAYSTPYQFTSGSLSLFNFSLSGSGTVTGETVCTYTSLPCTQQVGPTTGGSLIWSVSAPDRYEGVKLSPDGTLIAVSLAPYSTSSTTNIYQNGLLVTTVPGYAIGWIDNNQLLVNNYQIVQGTNHTPLLKYLSASIYSSAGSLISSPTLPELYLIQPITSSSIYAPSLNQILSLPSGTVTYSSTVPLTGAAAAAGPYVIFVSGSLIVTDTY